MHFLIVKYRNLQFDSQFHSWLSMVKLFTLFLFCSSVTFVYSQDIEAHIKGEINKILKYEVDIDPELTPGCVVGIFDTDTSFVLTFGNQAGNKDPIDSSAFFDLGGLSKIFLSSVIADFKSREILNGTDVVGSFLDFNPSAAIYNVTIDELITHRSGIPRELKFINSNRKNPYEDLRKTELINALAKTEIKKNNFTYSHYNYALLAIIAEEISDKKIHVIINDFLITNDLTEVEFLMNSTKLTANNPGFNKAGDIELGYNYGIMESSMGIQSNVNSLLNMIKHFYLSDNSILPLILEDRYKTGISKQIKFCNGLYIISESKKVTMFSHSGRTNRHSAAIHFVPETKTGVVILSNSESGTKELSLHILRMINDNWKRKPYGQKK